MIDNQYRLKDARNIFWREHAPITTDDNFKFWLLDYVSLQNMYSFYCKTLYVSYINV